MFTSSNTEIYTWLSVSHVSKILALAQYVSTGAATHVRLLQYFQALDPSLARRIAEHNEDH